MIENAAENRATTIGAPLCFALLMGVTGGALALEDRVVQALILGGIAAAVLAYLLVKVRQDRAVTPAAAAVTAAEPDVRAICAHAHSDPQGT